MMYAITGRLLKVGTESSVDRETGERRDRKFIQLLGDVPTRDGEDTKFAMVDLTVKDVRPYEALQDAVIRVPFGFFAAAKGREVLFVPKGSRPELVSTPEAA